MSATEERSSLDQALERQAPAPEVHTGEVVGRPADVVEASHARVKGRPESPLSASLRRRAEGDPDAVSLVFFEALSATKRVYLGDQWVDEPDHNVRLKAGDSIYNRLDGLPTTRTELTGADGGPVTLAALLCVDVNDSI